MHLLFVLLANSADHDKLSLDLQYDSIEKIKVSHGLGILLIEEGV